MSDTSHKRGPARGAFSLLLRLLLVCCLLIAGFAVVGYAAGWVQFQHDEQQQKATIEVETGEVKQAAEEAVGKGKELMNQASEKIEGLTEDNSGEQKNPPAETEGSADGATENEARDTSDKQ